MASVVKKLIWQLESALGCSRKAVHRKRMTSEDARERRIVGLLSAGNIHLQSGRYLTQQELDSKFHEITSR